MIQDEETSEPDKGLAQRQIIHLIYALFALGVLSCGVFGLAILAAVILAYLKRADLVGTVYAGHVDWVLRTFWWGLLWMVLSAVAMMIFIGYVTALAALIWVIYRLVKGWLAHCAGETPLPGL